MTTKAKLHLKLFLSTSLFCSSLVSTYAYSAPATDELEKYLVIATGESGVTFNFDGGELGADQEVTSSGSGDVNNGDPTDPNETRQIHGSYTSIGLDLTGDLVPVDGKSAFDSSVGNRWTDADPDHSGDTVGIPDFLPGARQLLEKPDYSGNVALTGSSASFVTENSDYFASIGIQCADSSTAGNGQLNCHDSFDADNSWKVDETTDFSTLSTGNGVSAFDPSALITEMSDWRNFINGLDAETTITDDYIKDRSYKEYDDTKTFVENEANGNTAFITDLDAIDTNGDGFAVIDLMPSDAKFLVQNSDWILSTLTGVTAIFRLQGDGKVYDFTNSSIMMGPGCLELDAQGYAIADITCDEPEITELGAIFYTDQGNSSINNEVFNLNNVILGGVALWDLDDDRDTIININNSQGCTQLISSEVKLSSKERYNRCAFAATPTEPPKEVSEPGSALIMFSGLLGLSLLRRRQTSI